jgi:hypothetical protein
MKTHGKLSTFASLTRRSVTVDITPSLNDADTVALLVMNEIAAT